MESLISEQFLSSLSPFCQLSKALPSFTEFFLLRVNVFQQRQRHHLEFISILWNPLFLPSFLSSLSPFCHLSKGLPSFLATESYLVLPSFTILGNEFDQDTTLWKENSLIFRRQVLRLRLLTSFIEFFLSRVYLLSYRMCRYWVLPSFFFNLRVFDFTRQLLKLRF